MLCCNVLVFRFVCLVNFNNLWLQVLLPAGELYHEQGNLHARHWCLQGSLGCLCRPTWQAFCDRHGYQLVVLHEPLDTSLRAIGRSMAWQKLICHEHPRLQGFDQLIWLDADIVVNPSAPDPCLKADLELINCCLEFDWGCDPQLAPMPRLGVINKVVRLSNSIQAMFSGYPQLWGEGAGP